VSLLVGFYPIPLSGAIKKPGAVKVSTKYENPDFLSENDKRKEDLGVHPKPRSCENRARRRANFYKEFTPA
jgi:hypothetical protein